MLTKAFRNLLLCIIALASTYAFSEEPPSLKDFKSVYAEYQKFSEAGEWSQSLRPAKSSYEIGEQLFGEDSKNTAALTYNYGFNLMQLGNNDEAEKILKLALKRFERTHGENSEELVPLLMDLGFSMAEPYQKAKQKKYYNRALRLVESHYGEESLEYAQRSLEAGIHLLNKAQSMKAKSYLYKAHELFEAKLGQKAPRAGYAAFHIGKYELATKDYKDAIRYFNKALVSFTVQDEPSNKLELSTHGFLVEAYERLDESDKATRHCLAIGRMTPATAVQDYQPLVKVAPIYPRSAQLHGSEGYVILEYEVDDFGFVRNPQVVDLGGPQSFADVAIKAAKKFRYAPSFRDGKAVTTSGVQNKFIFSLANKR